MLLACMIDTMVLLLLAIMIDTMVQVKGVSKKTLKENSTAGTVGSHGLKSSRPKSTNPKPFRLRTDVSDRSHSFP